MPMWRCSGFTHVEPPETTRSPIEIVPVVGGSSPAIARAAVTSCHTPDGPRSATVLAASTARDAATTALGARS